MSYQDHFDRIHRLTNELGAKLRDDPDVQDAISRLGGRSHRPLEVECTIDGGTVPSALERIAARQSKFPEQRLVYLTNPERGTLAHLFEQGMVDQRRLEKAEWEEQLVTRQFPLPQVHWDFAEEALQRTPPHRLEEAMNLHDLVKDVTLPRLGSEPLSIAHVRVYDNPPYKERDPFELNEVLRKIKSDIRDRLVDEVGGQFKALPQVPDDGRRLMRTLDGTQYPIGTEPPAAKPRTETWTGLNGTLTLEDGTTIPVRDGTLTITHKD